MLPLPPPPHNYFSEYCRYIWKFGGTCQTTIMSFIPTNYLKCQQNMKEIAVFECENAKIVQARSFIDFLNVSVLSVYFRL